MGIEVIGNTAEITIGMTAIVMTIAVVVLMIETFRLKSKINDLELILKVYERIERSRKNLRKKTNEIFENKRNRKDYQSRNDSNCNKEI